MIRAVSIGLLVLILIGGAVVAVHVFATRAFMASYGAYADVAKEHDNAAYIPGAEDSPNRQELNRILAGVLSDAMPEADRVREAERGRALLKDVEVQIDAIGSIGEGVAVALTTLEEDAGAFGLWQKADTATRIVENAHTRLDTIADIRGLSYRANHDTAKIFDRIIADGGVLTEAHVLDLNRQIPVVEEQFDLRANLYAELTTTTRAIERLARDMEKLW